MDARYRTEYHGGGDRRDGGRRDDREDRDRDWHRDRASDRDRGRDRDREWDARGREGDRSRVRERDGRENYANDQRTQHRKDDDGRYSGRNYDDTYGRDRARERDTAAAPWTAADNNYRRDGFMDGQREGRATNSGSNGRAAGAATEARGSTQRVSFAANTAPPAPAAPPAQDSDEEIIDDGEVEDEEVVAVRLLEESRKRREAILAKHNVSSVQPPVLPVAAPSLPSATPTPPAASPVSTKPASANKHTPHTDEKERLTTAVVATTELSVPSRKMLSMFDDDPEPELAPAPARATAAQDTQTAQMSLADNWDDPEGYYKINIGEFLNDRYKVLGSRGRGVFSSVLYCQDMKAVETHAITIDDDATIAAAAEGSVVTTAAPLFVDEDGVLKKTAAALATGTSKFVAVKVIRANDTMRRAGAVELELLRMVSTADPDSKYHCVKLLHHFEHRSHVCLVFEPLNMNLKEVQNKFGKGVGISIQAVRSYAKQMLLSLTLLAKLKIIHADIKPHNILANDTYNLIKLADFGSGFREDDPDNLPTPMRVSRFYRAPEIILGLPNTNALDMWSVACCIFELFTGDLLFSGVDNNDMLWKMQCLKGHFPHKMIKYHLRQVEAYGFEAHFDADLKFIRQGIDPVTKAPTWKAIEVTTATDDLNAMLMAKKAADDDKKTVGLLKDLLDKMLVLDPAKRITAKEALSHPFIRNK